MRTWEGYERGVREDEDLGVEEKMRLLSSLSKLRGLFGEGWPAEAFKEAHLLIAHMDNSARWFRLWLINFVSMLDEEKDLPGQIGIVSRVKNANQFEGAYELKVASRLKTNGFYIEINPKVDGKHADMLARKGDETLYIKNIIPNSSKN